MTSGEHQTLIRKPLLHRARRVRRLDAKVDLPQMSSDSITQACTARTAVEANAASRGTRKLHRYMSDL
ncbi:hypothetical protein GCM10017687_70230 [Streptomyces echinatus]|uniref:Uncharacterized protein n=1 Tax=Streptomyces echinatus TaxID=67293 RepID=A0A7W9UPN3_9ACTN|nr:hypothetical protein [Streptomyces echinatus]